MLGFSFQIFVRRVGFGFRFPVLEFSVSIVDFRFFPVSVFAVIFFLGSTIDFHFSISLFSGWIVVVQFFGFDFGVGLDVP